MQFIRTSLLACLFASTAAAAQMPVPAPFQVQNIAPGIEVIFGGGGNVTMDHGGARIFLVDAKSPNVAEQFVSAVHAVSAKPVMAVVNTHWHFDHVGANQLLHKAGASVIAQANVRHRMADGGTISFLKMAVEPAPKNAAPGSVYQTSQTLKVGSDTVQLVHVARAHTDGDTLVKWAHANVLATGDIYIRHGLPFVDLSSGGSLRGFIAAVDKCIALSDDHTVVVPGHGELSTRADLVAFRDRLKAITDAIDEQVRAGKSLSEIQALRLADAWPKDARDFVKPDQFVAMAVESLRD
ncbi:MBL fold metallo-hydrolase [Variovorax sp. H27-G14]|uniref:MBL fold metallo-hydrolase n=1 Tax=Variovorax sp. H27-G14 TaxID=3111914 RepID=UPI0038FC2C93